MIGLLLVATLAAGPQSRLFIATGAKTKAEAEKLQKALALPRELRLSPGYPKLVESKSMPGLNPGFFLVVLGACADETAAQTSHGNGLAALIQRGLKGAYAKPVTVKADGCPLWVEPTDTPPAKLADLEKKPDDVKLLFEVARELDQGGALVGASILLRRATALGASDQPTLDLLRKVEFVLEDAPFRLPP
jgi:hypothetical protein